MNHILVDKTVIVPENTPYVKKDGLAPLNAAETTVDTLAVKTLVEDQENLPPAPVEGKLKKAVDLTQFRVYSQEEIDKMDIQKLLMTLLQGCFLVQHESKRLNGEFIQTLQRTLDAVVQKLSAQQACTNWAFPAFLSIGIGGVAGVCGNYKAVAESLSGATKVLGDIMQQTDKAKETPTGAEQSQLHSSLQSYREQAPTANNEKEKTLNDMKASIDRLLDMCMRINS